MTLEGVFDGQEWTVTTTERIPVRFTAGTYSIDEYDLSAAERAWLAYRNDRIEFDALIVASAPRKRRSIAPEPTSSRLQSSFKLGPTLTRRSSTIPPVRNPSSSTNSCTCLAPTETGVYRTKTRSIRGMGTSGDEPRLNDATRCRTGPIERSVLDEYVVVF